MLIIIIIIIIIIIVAVCYAGGVDKGRRRLQRGRSQRVRQEH